MGQQHAGKSSRTVSTLRVELCPEAEGRNRAERGIVVIADPHEVTQGSVTPEIS